jgi:hypothetical protein
MILIFGLIVKKASSNLTWSFPLPFVHVRTVKNGESSYSASVDVSKSLAAWKFNSPMADKLASFLCSNLHLSTSNDRSGQAGSEQVSAFILAVSLDGSVAQLLDKLALQVENDHLGSSEQGGLFADLVPVLLLCFDQLCAVRGRINVRPTSARKQTTS